MLREENQPGDEGQPAARSASGRRQFLQYVAATGAGVAGLTFASGETAQANAPPAEDLRGDYETVQNLFRLTLSITSQNGNAFSGVITEGTNITPISGTVTGSRPTGDNAHPITVVFNRVLADGTIQTHIGAAATGQGGLNRLKFLAGVFYHNGLGPFPWRAEATIVG